MYGGIYLVHFCMSWYVVLGRFVGTLFGCILTPQLATMYTTLTEAAKDARITANQTKNKAA